jgi:hypothetical protein
VGTYEKVATGATGNLIVTEYAASQWAGLEINGATNDASVDTDTSDSNTIVPAHLHFSSLSSPLQILVGNRRRTRE